MSHSETESESEYLPPTAAESAPAFAHKLSSEIQQNTHLETKPWSITLALKHLESLDFQLVRKDDSLHKGILFASSAILKFLDSLLALRFDDDEGIEHALKQLIELWHPSFLCLLFQYRRLFHNIATRGLAAGAAIHAVICWVDVILAKFGVVASFVAGGLQPVSSQRCISVTLQLQNEDNQLRAAAQLPDRWCSITSVISSSSASPAAKRLALQLLLARYIVLPQLGSFVEPIQFLESERIKTTELYAAVLDFLQHSFARLSTSCSISGITWNDFVFEERMTCAMALSLFAVTDLHRKDQADTELLPPFRPDTANQLLCLLQCVMNPETTSTPHPIAPHEKLDVPQTILIRWGKFIHWSWTLWADQQHRENEVIVHLTITWLHCGSSQLSEANDEQAQDWNLQLIPVILDNIVPAISVMSQILNCCEIWVSSPCNQAGIAAPLVDVVLKTAWIFAQLAELNANSGIVNRSPDVCALFLSIFVLTCCADDHFDVREQIIRILSHTSKECILKGLQALQMNDLHHFNTTFEEVLHRMTSQLPSNTSAAFLLSRQLLNFVTLLWAAGANSLPESISPFLIAVARTLSIDHLKHSKKPVLLDSLMNTLAASYTTKSSGPSYLALPLDNKIFWEMMINTDRTDLFIASSFAHTVIATCQMHGSLICVEVWDYLRDVLALINSHYFLGDHEPLALIVAPIICHAMICLLKHADSNAMNFITCSPWTLGLHAMLQSLLCDELPASSEYSIMLRSRMHSIGNVLLHQISWNGTSSGQPQLSNLEIEYQLMFIRMDSVSRILFVRRDI
ncbi:hypothetical protein BJ138DRAFT_1142007 [Hygrophoropsis aurantiaca]|uniref:Uncharacterized protein n=1 Tax=Hygrophoropsis aurantiaca TaxID=72124 RepID=A0ACB8AQ81_9AGAM|nr:hypothetical protein BJ138DRAFT_1142007 [Hygrophoropsis aurantiaca]